MSSLKIIQACFAVCLFTSHAGASEPDLQGGSYPATITQTTKAEQRPFHFRISAGGSIWRAIEVSRLSVLYDTNEITLRGDIGWFIDPWLCDIEAATGTHCQGQQWAAKLGPELFLSQHIRVPLQLGVFYRWGRERMPDPFRTHSSVRVLRTESGLSFNPGLVFESPVYRRTALGFEITLSALVPASRSYQHPNYLSEPIAILEPKASVFVELTP